MKHTLLILFLSSFFVQAIAQSTTSQRTKGDFYFYWGYNRAWYSGTNITFTGPGYDFELEDVKSRDKPLEFSFSNYFKPTNISIPQYVYRIGYFVSENWCVSIGMDHMKYVMYQDKSVVINGQIQQDENPFNGVYNNDQIELTEEFLTFEHTDGLNYLNVGADYYYDLFTLASGKITGSLVGGGGLGAYIPKSNVQLMSGERNDVFHLAGWGFHGNLGGQLTFWRHLFLRTQVKGGYALMPDVLTRPDGVDDRAKHNFWFVMWDMALGAQWHF